MVIKHFYKIKQTDIEIIMSRKNDQNKRGPVQSEKVNRKTIRPDSTGFDPRASVAKMRTYSRF